MSNPFFGYRGMNDIAVQTYKTFLIYKQNTKKIFLGGMWTWEGTSSVTPPFVWVSKYLRLQFQSVLK